VEKVDITGLGHGQKHGHGHELDCTHELRCRHEWERTWAYRNSL